MDILTEDGSAWRSEFADRARPFRTRWRRQRLFTRALATLWLPILVLAILLALLRFTLLDLPDDPPALAAPGLIWLAALLVLYLLDRPPLLRVARAIDRQLDLDARLGTALALSYTTPPPGFGRRLVQRQRRDALDALEAQGPQAAKAFRPAAPRLRRPLIAAGGLALALVPILLLPSPVAAQRAERDAIRNASLAQAAQLAALRRELVARPELSTDARSLLDAQLAAAEATLRNTPTDRAATVAALGQASDALRALLPDNAAKVSDTREAVAHDLLAALSNVVDDPTALTQGDNDLERAASAAAHSLVETSQAPALRRPSELALATSLEQLAVRLDATDPTLAAALRNTAAALRQDSATGRQALQDLAKALQTAAQQQTASDLLANTLAQLDAGKQNIAQAGLAPVSGDVAANNRPFGRRTPTDPAGPAGPNGPAGAGGAQTGDGSAQPAGAGGQSAGQDGGAPASANGGPAAPAGAQPGSGNAGGTSAQIGSTGSTNLPSNVQGGGGTSSDTGGNAGTGSGRVSVTGTGEGTAGSGTFDPVYVPDGAPQVAAGGPQDRVPGVESPGQGQAPDTSSLRTGPGYLPGVKTPYNNVIGQYRDAAAQALDQTIIPADAKQYVRDYFNSLEPAP